MASKLSTLQEKLELLAEDYELTKEHLERSIIHEKSALLANAADATRLGARSSETYGSFFVKLGDFYFGVSTVNGKLVDIEEVSKRMVDERIAADA